MLHIRAIATIGDSTAGCAIPDFGVPEQYKLPVSINSSFVSVVDQYKSLLCSIPLIITPAFLAQHIHKRTIYSRHVPAHYCSEVERQTDHMLKARYYRRKQ